MKKKAVVSGGCGFIGSNLVKKLIELDYEVIVLDNLSTGFEKNIHPQSKFIKIDISESSCIDNLISEVKNADAFFHMAALARVQFSIEDPVHYNKHNINGTLNMLELSKRANIKKFIFSSSSAVYGNSKNYPSTETDFPSPISPYGLQKLIGEQYCQLYSSIYDLKTVCLRYFNVFGNNQPTEGAYCTVVGIFLKQKEQSKALTITNDGNQRRDFTYVGDVVSANILSSISSDVGEGECFNVGSGNNISVNEIADVFEIERKYIGNVLEPKETLANISKIKKTFSWNPTVELIDWLKNEIKC